MRINGFQGINARCMAADGGGGGEPTAGALTPPPAMFTQAQLDDAVSEAIEELGVKHADELAAKDLDHALRGQLTDAHDVDLVLGLLDKGKLKLADGKVEGLEDQLKGLRESKSFLFAAKHADSLHMTGAAPADAGGKSATNTDALAAEIDKFFKA